MKKRIDAPLCCHFRISALLLGLILLLDAPPFLIAAPTAAATADFEAYCRAQELRMRRQYRSATGFLEARGSDVEARVRLRRGEILLERLTPDPGATSSGAMLHHWLGTAFVPAVKAAEFEHLIRDFNAYPQEFSPQVLQAKVLRDEGSRMQARMRVRQHHVITVVLDATFEVELATGDAQRGYVISRSTRIAEIGSAGTPAEHPLTAGQEHGFLWRLDTYWSYEERDGGLYLQLETVSLTRSLPAGLAWAIRPYVDSVPRESLEFTLRSMCLALGKQAAMGG